MNGIPEKISESLLVAAKLIQVCIGENETILHFDNGTSVTLECDVSLVVGRGSTKQLSGSVATGAALLPLLGAGILAVDRKTQRDLVIQFERDAIVTLHDSNEHYESFSIVNGAERVIV